MASIARYFVDKMAGYGMPRLEAKFWWDTMDISAIEMSQRYRLDLTVPL